MENNIGYFRVEWDACVKFTEKKADYGAYFVIYKEKDKKIESSGDFKTLYFNDVIEWSDGTPISNEDKEKIKLRIAWWKTDWKCGACSIIY